MLVALLESRAKAIWLRCRTFVYMIKKAFKMSVSILDGWTAYDNHSPAVSYEMDTSVKDSVSGSNVFF